MNFLFERSDFASGVRAALKADRCIITTAFRADVISAAMKMCFGSRQTILRYLRCPAPGEDFGAGGPEQQKRLMNLSVLSAFFRLHDT